LRAYGPGPAQGTCSVHWSAWQAARVEVKQEEAAVEKQEEDVAADVVDAVIERTSVQPAEGA
jgi:hypothetical protein